MIRFAGTECSSCTSLHFAKTSSIYHILKSGSDLPLCVLWCWGKGGICFRTKTRNHIAFHNPSNHYHFFQEPILFSAAPPCYSGWNSAWHHDTKVPSYPQISGKAPTIGHFILSHVLPTGSLITQLTLFLEKYQVILLLWLHSSCSHGYYTE